ncbi:MAG: hypothetical protein ACK40G_17280 [Cytophagaceae bacterium]
MTLSKIKAILRSKDYKVFYRPYELNIVGLRSKNTTPNTFDDEFHIFYIDEFKKWHYHVFKGTTDPGTFWLRNPEFPKGTAILKAGQYVDAYQIGYHKGSRPGLIQAGPVTVIRDFDRDDYLDFKGKKEETGHFGINIHGPSEKSGEKYVDKDSAGCQVPMYNVDHIKLMTLAERHRQIYGNKFTYTLIDFRAARRLTRLRIAMALSLIAAIGSVHFTFNKSKNQ